MNFFQFGRRRIKSYAEAEAERHRNDGDSSGDDEGLPDMEIQPDSSPDESDVLEGILIELGQDTAKVQKRQM